MSAVSIYELHDQTLPFEHKFLSDYHVWSCIQPNCDGEHHYYIRQP